MSAIKAFDYNCYYQLKQYDNIEGEEGEKKGKGADNSSSSSIDECDIIGVVNESDVSPNTPGADETWLLYGS
jgi:hypothetical protein